MAEPFIGEVDLYGFNFAPDRWSRCEGQMLLINDNQALFSLLGTAFGGDGRTTFALPDLRGRLPTSFGLSQSSGAEYKMGQAKGAEQVTLTLANLPNHAHLATFTAKAETTAQWHVSVSPATKDKPENGSFLAYNDGGRNPGVFMYTDDPTSTVVLGGVSGNEDAIRGNAELSNNGFNQPFYLMQPSLVANFCISLWGLFPSRN